MYNDSFFYVLELGGDLNKNIFIHQHFNYSSRIVVFQLIRLKIGYQFNCWYRIKVKEFGEKKFLLEKIKKR